MGAIKTPAKVQVAFAYEISAINAEWTLSVVANVYPGKYLRITDRAPEHCTDDADDTTAEVVSICRLTRKDGFQVCDELPAFILEAIAEKAVEEYEEKYCERLNEVG
jgi:hypothetical protein